MKTVTVSALNVEFVEYHKEAGLIYSGSCPDCGSTIRIGDYSWWNIECDCGREWGLNINVSITATIEEK